MRYNVNDFKVKLEKKLYTSIVRLIEGTFVGETLKVAYLFLFLILPLSAQNVFVWDGEAANLSGNAWDTYLQSQGYTVTHPAVNSVLPTDYSSYDAIFLNFGVY
ncbi:MAG: hypothetical protein ACE5D8_04785, partial [Fidelibacterota bacterium]